MKNKSAYIKLAISAALIFLVCFKIDWRAFKQMLLKINLFYFILSFAVSAFMLSISCLKWQALLYLQGKPVGFLFLLKNYYIGYLFSMLLPSNIGGDVVRSYYIGKRIDDQYISAVSVFIERFSGILFLLLLVIAAPWIRPEIVSTWLIMLPMIAAFLIIVLFIIFSVCESLPARFDQALSALLSSILKFCEKGNRSACARIVRQIQSVYYRCYAGVGKFHTKLRAAVGYFRHRTGYLILVIVITVVFYCATWVNVFVSFKAFNIDVPFADVAALVPTILFVAMIPVSLGSIGLAEGAYVVYFTMVGVTGESALIMSLLIRFKLIIIALTGFFFYITYKHRRQDYAIMAASDKQQTEVE